MIEETQIATFAKAFVMPLPLSLNFQSARLTDEQFEAVCRNHPDLKFELSAKGELILMPPTSLESGWRNSDINFEFVSWSRKDKTGIVFDSSTMFTFPDGAKRSPDVAWIRRERVVQLSPAERQSFAHIVPDFVSELRSPTDSLAKLQKKMREYIANGVRLGWLIDPSKRRVHIYRADGSMETLENPAMVSGEDVLPGFELNVPTV